MLYKAGSLEGKKRLIIVSPFLSMRRIRWYDKALKRLREDNVEIIVFTKPQNELLSEMHNDSINYLRDIGIEIKYLRGIHSKFIGIDNDVCYTGSLNPLSHSCTLETMIRFKGSGCVDAFLEQMIRSSNPYSSDKAEMKEWLTEEELRKAIKDLRGRIIGEKGGRTMFVLPNSKIEDLIKELPSSIERFLNHSSIRNNNISIFLDNNVEDFIFLCKMRIRVMKQEILIEKDKERQKREKEREKEEKKRAKQRMQNKSTKKKK